MYLTRLTYNTQNWSRPSGPAGKEEAASSFTSMHGYGHEEWLFRFDWMIDGWQYGFVQGVNRSRSKILKLNKPIDLLLYTMEPSPGKGRRLIGTIHNAECLNDHQAKAVVAEYKKRGWFEQMQQEIAAADGNPLILGHTPLAKDILNLRFTHGDYTPINPPLYIPQGHPALDWRRYQAYAWPVDDGVPIDDILPDDLATAAKPEPTTPDKLWIPNLEPYLRQQVPACTVHPEHRMMQVLLREKLLKHYPPEAIKMECDGVDVRVDVPESIRLYEIKSYLEPRTVIREALGQLLEYGFHPHRQYNKLVTLIIVGRKALDHEGTKYLNTLKQKFSLPLDYEHIELE